MRVWVYAAVAASVALTSCETNSVAVQGRFPAKSAEAANLRTIAVLDFANQDGQGFASLLRAELQNATLDGERYFTVVSDDALLSGAGVSSYRGSSRDLSAALETGRRAGVDAVYFGEVVALDTNRNSQRQEKTRCTEWDGIFDCETRERYMTTCHDLTATYAVALQVVNVANGTLAYTETLGDSASGNYCDEDSMQVDPNQLLAQARANVVATARKAVAPYDAVMRVNFKSAAPDLPAAAAEAFASGAEFARAGRMDRACAIWQELAPGGSTTSVPLLYNLGVCAETVGDFNRAVELYTIADSLLTTPDNEVYQARQRALSQRAALQTTGL